MYFFEYAKSFLYRMLLKRKHTFINPTAIILNVKKIDIGSNVIVGRHAFIRGGQDPSSHLKIGDNVVIRMNTYLSSRHGDLSIGKNTYFAHSCWLGGQGTTTIGMNCLFGPNVVSISSNHDYNNISTPYHKGDELPGVITIGDNVWIGANAVILPNVKIGNGAVIGAGSVVTSDVPARTLFVGNPAIFQKNLRS